MTMVWVAFLMVTGVMFGVASLVIDLGYGMIQVRAMQNGADAGAFAAAKLAAGSVIDDGAGGVMYSVPNGAIYDEARRFAFYNHPASLLSSDYEHIAVQYLPCPTPTGGTPNWAAQSDPAIVAQIGGTRQSTTTAVIPAWTCSLRVYARVTHNSLFARAIGRPTQTEGAQATARIMPTAPPTQFSNVWPLTRWVCNGKDYLATTNKDESKSINDVGAADGDDKCDDEEPPCTIDPANPQPCTFWDSNSDPQGNWKNYLDFSRFSDLAKGQGITREQNLAGWAAGCATAGPSYCPVQFDATRPGTNDKINDVPHWVRNGWRGMLVADPADCVNVVNVTLTTAQRDYLTNPTQCRNSRIELMSGDIGNNIASAARDYITNNLAGNSAALCGGAGSDNDYAVVTVVLWRWGEMDSTANSIALTNTSKLWGYYQSNRTSLGLDNNPQPNDLKRVIMQRATLFRFCRGWVASSNIRGYFVAFTNLGSPPVCPTAACTPSPVANTVVMTD